MDYVLEYPTWSVWLCLIAGGIYAFFLYRKDKMLSELPSWAVTALALFRFLSVSAICILLLGILIRKEEKVVEKPIILLGHDTSKSIVLNKDSLFYQGEYKQSFQRFVDRLSANYEVKYFNFDDRLISDPKGIKFDGMQSDPSLFFNEVINQYQNRNIGAVVLASDGIYNKGFNPASLASSIRNTGIYSIALGDTTIKKDLLLEKLSHNKVAYLGNDFPLEVLLKADKLKGEKSVLKILKNEKLVHEKIIDIDQSLSIQNHAFRLEADKPGTYKITVKLDPIEGEFTYSNNESSFFIDVQNNRQKILILANSPHPDIGALKNAIELNDGYEVDLKYADKFDGKISAYGLLIMHQLPSSKFKMSNVLTQISEKRKPTWFFLGSQTRYSDFNKLNTGLKHIGFRGQLDAVKASVNPNFSAFGIPPELLNLSSDLHVVHVPFGNVRIGSSVNVLMYQKLGNLQKEEPLMMFNKWNGVRTGVFVGEGIWHWQLEDKSLFQKIIQKSVQYLVTKEDKSFFRLSGKDLFSENESIIFEAELFNESYELINNHAVGMKVVSENGDDYEFDFMQNGRAYRLDLGKLPTGRYTYTATANVDGKNYEKTGEFSVQEIRVEYANTVANHQLLYNIANNNGGEMVYPNELDLLYDKIMGRDDLVNVSYPLTKYSNIIDYKWIFFLLVALLSVEWFLRKRYGAY